jgi:hypothetical protein
MPLPKLIGADVYDAISANAASDMPPSYQSSVRPPADIFGVRAWP